MPPVMWILPLQEYDPHVRHLCQSIPSHLFSVLVQALIIPLMLLCLLKLPCHPTTHPLPMPGRGTCFSSSGLMHLVRYHCIYLFCSANKPLSLEQDQHTFQVESDDTYANVMLIRHGCLGSSPLYPTVAIMLQTLELYRQTHHTSPQFSIQSKVQMLCHMHNVSSLSLLPMIS